MTSSVSIDQDSTERRPRLWIDGEIIDMTAVRLIEYRFVPGEAAVLTVEYCVGGSHLPAASPPILA